MQIKLFNAAQKRKAIEAITKAPPDHVAEIRQKKRTLEQNALLWRLLAITAQAVPWQVNGSKTMLTAAEWKDIFTASVKQETRLAKGVRGGFVMLGLHSSTMTVSQMGDLIAFIEHFLAEKGVSTDVSE